MTDNGLGPRIRRLRQNLSMSQPQLAEVLGVTKNTISTWETEKYVPEIEMFCQLAQALNVTLDELWYGGGKADEAGSRLNRIIAYCKPLNDSALASVEAQARFWYDQAAAVQRANSAS